MMKFALLAAVATLLLAFDASAAESLIHELNVGVLAHDVPDLWSGFRRETVSADINIEAKLSPSMAVFFGTIRPAIGASISTDGQTNMGYIDARYTYDAPSGWFFGVGLGGAIHDGNTGKEDPNRKALGSRLLFHIPLEIGYRIDAHNSLSAYFEHTSNAYTQTYNEGMDRLGIRYGYRF
jgi:lipid A 3-O-deacylase